MSDYFNLYYRGGIRDYAMKLYGDDFYDTPRGSSARAVFSHVADDVRSEQQALGRDTEGKAYDEDIYGENVVVSFKRDAA